MLRLIHVSTVLMLLFPAALAVAAEPQHAKESLPVVKARVANGSALIIDVREKEEWDDGHLLDAILIPLSELQKNKDPKEFSDKLRKDKILYLHCRSGQRCLVAAEKLQELGYNARALKQGYDDLVIAGFKKAEKK